MIELVQAGQAGKTTFLFDMHRLRARVFKEKMGWDVQVTPDNLEIDQFDLPDTVYLLALNKDSRVIGTWRLLPTTGPTMIRDVWPQYLDSISMPTAPDVWEVSRFAIDPLTKDPDEAARETQRAIGEMFCALTEACIAAGVREIYTFYDERIATVIDRIDCKPYKTSDKIETGGAVCRVGAFKTDEAMLQRLRQATKITERFMDNIFLPPAMAEIKKS